MLGSLHWDGAFAEADAEGRGWRPVGLECGSRTIPVDRTNHCQGVLYLSDCGREAGGFRCCPGFHKEFRQWLANLPPDYEPNESPNLIEKHARELGEALAPRAVTVAASAGSLVIWHRLLPHGSGRNLSSLPRYAQYITMGPHAAGEQLLPEARVAEGEYVIKCQYSSKCARNQQTAAIVCIFGRG